MKHARWRQVRFGVLPAVVFLLAACTVGPDYVRPAIESPVAFKELAGWTQAAPRDQEIKGKWWQIFNDPLLDRLQEQVDISNQTLANAEAQFRQARALVAAARAAYFPVVSAGANAARSRASATTFSQTTISRGVVSSYSLPVQATWEIDLWGGISRGLEANEAGAQASAGVLEAARLSAHAALAQDYFQLRILDAQKRLLGETIAAYRRSVQLTQNQYNAGVVAKGDVVQAQAQLKSAEAQALDLGVQRAQMEHAIALLVGKPPALFAIEAAPLVAMPPAVPVGLPSQLLERRPDVAVAERRMAAANAQIGVAKAAFFPSFTLSAAVGYQGATVGDWFNAPSRFWSIGPALAATLFEGGLRRAQSEQALASYDATLATYRQTVLIGLQEVEDNLAALRILEEEAKVQGEALQYARQAVAIANNQYQAGIVSYLSVVTFQSAALASEKNALDLLNRRLAASVLLIKALGGGWSAAMLPSSEELTNRSPISQK